MSQLAKITSLPQQAWRFILESRDELKKVSWPTRQDTIRYTTIVILSSLAVGALVGVVDYFLTWLLEQTV